MGGRREVSIISHRLVTRSDLKQGRSFFRESVSTFLQLVVASKLSMGPAKSHAKAARERRREFEGRHTRRACYNQFSPGFEYGFVLLATLIRGEGGITSTRSWTGHLCQYMVQCLKYFCDLLSHFRFTSKSDFDVFNFQTDDYSDIHK